MQLQVRPVGASALLLEVADADDAGILWREIETRRAAGELGTVVDVVPGARTVLLDGVLDRESLIRRVLGWVGTGDFGDRSSAVPVGPSVDVPVVYDGPDLAEVAAGWGVTVEEAVRLHAGADYTVAFCGFSPGFAYLTGLPAELAGPRRPSPRPLVPAGAVGLAGSYCGVYPRPSPGGWQLIGRTELRVWDATRADPALLVPGTRVHFVPSPSTTGGPT